VLETWLFPNHDIRIYLLDMNNNWTNEHFQTWITRNYVNCESLFHLSCLTLILLTWRIWWAPNNASKWQMGFNSAFKGLMTLMGHLFTERAPNVQIKYFIFGWSIYNILVLNTSWTPDSFQMMIFVNVSLKWGMVELKHVLRRV
jgi:hypothetical protein